MKKSKFLGSFAFSSPDMQRALKQSARKLDLYYNDAYGLDLSLNKLFQIKMPQNLLKTAYDDSKFQLEIRQFT